MALQLSTYITGKVNNLVFYERAGRHIVRTMPEKVTQTAATKQRSSNFSIAATAGKLLRRQLGNHVVNAKDKGMQNRFGGAIAKWIGTQDVGQLAPQDALPFLTDFNFNEATSIRERCRLAWDITTANEASITIHLPEFIAMKMFTAPAHTSHIDCCFATACCKLQQALPEASGSNHILQLPFNGSIIPAQVISLPVNFAPGNLVVTTLTIRYYPAKGADTRPAFMPSGVVEARYC